MNNFITRDISSIRNALIAFKMFFFDEINFFMSTPMNTNEYLQNYAYLLVRNAFNWISIRFVEVTHFFLSTLVNTFECILE